MALEENSSAEAGISRRTIVKGAAWAAPVMIAAVAVPSAVASINNSSLSWSQSAATSAIAVLGSTTPVASSAPITLPTQFRLTNGPGAINATADISIVVSRPTPSINFSKGTTHGFGVAKLNGADVSGQNSLAYEANKKGFPATTFAGTFNFSTGSNGIVNVPIVFGLSGSKTTDGAISTTVTFPVSLTVTFGTKVYTANTSIVVPSTAAIL